MATDYDSPGTRGVGKERVTRGDVAVLGYKESGGDSGLDEDDGADGDEHDGYQSSGRPARRWRCSP